MAQADADDNGSPVKLTSAGKKELAELRRRHSAKPRHSGAPWSPGTGIGGQFRHRRCFCISPVPGDLLHVGTSAPFAIAVMV
jgi:hypothetical protein